MTGERAPGGRGRGARGAARRGRPAGPGRRVRRALAARRGRAAGSADPPSPGRDARAAAAAPRWRTLSDSLDANAGGVAKERGVSTNGRIAFLGPEGTFTEEALLRNLPDAGRDAVPLPDHPGRHGRRAVGRGRHGPRAHRELAGGQRHPHARPARLGLRRPVHRPRGHPRHTPPAHRPPRAAPGRGHQGGQHPHRLRPVPHLHPASTWPAWSTRRRTRRPRPCAA